MLEADFTLNYKSIEIKTQFSVESGKVLGLFGPSGIGKSSILRSIAGLEKITSGRISYNGEIWDDSAKKFYSPQERNTGFVFQDYALFPNMTVKENIAFGQIVDNGELSEIISALEIEDILDKNSVFLSGGQKQRVAMGRALANDSQVLLLDEPFSALDKKNKSRIRRFLKDRILTKNVVTLLASHDLNDLQFFDAQVVHIGDMLT